MIATPWTSRSRRAEELDAEIRAHLEMAIAEHMARGASRADAERAARREFGNATHIAEVTRDMWGGRWIERIAADVRYASRALLRVPVFTGVAVLTLALGIGANVAVFTVLNGVLLRPLPFRDPGRLFLLTMDGGNTGPFERPPSLDEQTFVEMRRRSHAFERVAMFAGTQMTLTGAGDPVRLSAGSVTADFMAALGVNAAIGRTFLSDEDTPGKERVVLLGDQLWRGRFGADAGIVGKTLSLDGTPHVVIGVMPGGMTFPYAAQLWVPMVVGADAHNAFVRPVVGRLAAGATADAAQRELEHVASSVPRRDEARFLVLPLKDLLTAKVRSSLFVFAGAVGFVLLIACANVANLLLIRAATRRHEVGVRRALGASRARLLTSMLTESVIIAMLGGALGLWVSVWGVRALLALAPQGRIPRVEEIHADVTVLSVSFVATIVVGVLSGLIPAIASTRGDLRTAMTDGGRTTTGGHERVRRILVMAELAIAIVLLTGAGLLQRSFARIRAVDPGFRPDSVIAMNVNLPQASYRTAASMRVFHATVVDRLTRIPGVRSAAVVNWAPLNPQLLAGDFHVENVTRSGWADKMAVSPGYFRTMGIALLHGRDFTAQDDDRVPGVVILSRAVARRFWPPDGAAAIGTRITMDDHPSAASTWLTVVGVVDDVVQQSFTKARDPALYQPVAQTTHRFFLSDMTFAVRTSANAADVAGAMRAVIHELDANLPVERIRTMQEMIASTMAAPRFEARLLAVFSLLALILAAVGTYGVLAYDVAARTHEIGVRMALGARRGDVVRMVLRRAVGVAVPGIVLGVAGALALTRVLAGSLFEVRPTDPTTFGTVCLVLAAVALAASVIPARRATRVHPVTALRHD